MKKMKLTLASISLQVECYKRKCKNVSKVLNIVKKLNKFMKIEEIYIIFSVKGQTPPKIIGQRIGYRLL